MIYICVLNYNNSKDTIECLKSLDTLVDVSYKIILIDNASTDDSYSVLKRYTDKKRRIVLIKSAINKGYAGGNNIALNYALKCDDMDYCWILNNDTIVDKMSLKYLKKYMDDNPTVGLCGSKLMYEWNRNKIQGYGGCYNKFFASSASCTDEDKIDKIDYIIGAACMVSRRFLEDIGLMNEDYFLYFEEIDWAYRSKGRYKLGCEPKSIVYHKEGASIGAGIRNKENKSLVSDYFSLRNRIFFSKKYNPYCLPIVYVGLVISMLNRLRRKQYYRALMILKMMFGWRDEKLENLRKI